MLTERIETLLVGNATGLVRSFQEGGTAAEGLQAKGTTAGGVLEKLGLQGVETGAMLKAGLAGGALVAGTAIAKFALDGAQHFVDLTGQVRSLRNVMGGTAEDASRVAGATRALGLDTDTVSKGFFQLTKRIADNKDTLAQNGIEIARNNDGSVNMARTLGSVSDGFRSMTDPAERNLFLMQNFGRSGAQLIPLLSQGSEKLREFYDQTAKHGEVFSEADLEKGREYKIQLNEMNDAWQGLSTQLGRDIVPLLTQFMRGLTTIIEAVPQMVEEFDRFTHISDVMHAVGDAVSFVGDALGISGDKAAVVGVHFDDLQARFAGLDSSRAAAAFAQLNREAMNTEGHVGKSNQALIDFVQIAQADVGAAQQVVDGLKAQGVNTTVYERALHNIASTKYQDLLATQQQKDAETLLTGSYEQQLGILNKLEDAQLALFDKDIQAQQSALAAKDAVDQYNQASQAAADAGNQDAAANEAQSKALLEAEQSALRAAAAAGQKAAADHEGEGAAAAHAAQTYAQITVLQGLANTLDPGSPLRQALEGYAAKLSDPAINGIHTAGVALDLPDLGPLGDLLTMLNNLKNIGDVNVRVNVAQTEFVPGSALGSDRNSKLDIEPVDVADLLATLEQLEVLCWRYDTDPRNIRHVGPMAQDFYAAFGLGDSDTTIGIIDALGVLFAGVQALAQRVRDLEHQGAAHAA